MIGLFKIFDAHVHFYSNSYFKFLVRQKINRLDINAELKNLAAKGRIEVPVRTPSYWQNVGSKSLTSGRLNG